MKQVIKYIKDRIDGEPYYNLLKWQASTVIAGVQTITIPTETGENVEFFNIKQISISTDGLGGTINFFDARFPGAPLFGIINIIPYFKIAPFEYLSYNTRLTIVTNSATVLFSIGFITVSRQEKKQK